MNIGEYMVITFWMGALGGVHCLAMCGSLVGVLSASMDRATKKKPATIAIYHLAYNFGRIGSYVLMGAVLSAFSALLLSSIQIIELGQILRIFSAVIVIFVGLFIAGWGNFLGKIEKLGQKLWTKLQPISRKFLPISSLKDAFLFGLLWGGIPCGLVYGALSIAISTADVANGALIMLAFGIGTLPALLAMAGFAVLLTDFLQNQKVRKTAGIIIILIGGYSLTTPLKMMFV